MTLPPAARRFSKGDLSAEELRKIVRSTAKGTFAAASVRKAAERLIAQAENDDVASDLIVHDGDLTLPSLDTGMEPFIGLLVVKGDLVEGLFRDSLDPESTVIVTGHLRADRLISSGFLEVHGSVVVEREALWRDNDGCAEISGDLQAGFLFTKYHAVKVGGRVIAPLVLGDEARFECEKEYAFVKETDGDHKNALLAVLPRKALSIAGDPEGGDEDEWWIDYVDDEVLAKLVAQGQPVLQGPWPPKGPRA